MPPVFEQRTPPPLAPGCLFKKQWGVVAQAGKQRQVMGAHHGIDRVDLQHTQALDHAIEVRSLDRRRPLAAGKTLGRQGHASSLLDGKRQVGGHETLLVDSPTTLLHPGSFLQRGLSEMQAATLFDVAAIEPGVDIDDDLTHGRMPGQIHPRRLQTLKVSITAHTTRKAQNSPRNMRSGSAWATFTPQLILSRPPTASGTPIIQSTSRCQA